MPAGLVLVGDQLVLDVAGTVRVVEGAQGLHEISIRRRDAHNHQRLAGQTTRHICK